MVLNSKQKEFIEKCRAFALLVPMQAAYLYVDRIAIYSNQARAWGDYLKPYGTLVTHHNEYIEIIFPYHMHFPYDLRIQARIEQYLEGTAEKLSFEN